MKPALYAHPFASYCWKVLVALYENDTAFAYRSLGPEDPEAAIELEALWPLKRFPVLVDAGRTVIESSVIIEYLMLRHPGPVRLIPADAEAALEVRFLDRDFDNYIMTPVSKIVTDRLRSEDQRDPYGVDEARAALDPTGRTRSETGTLMSGAIGRVCSLVRRWPGRWTKRGLSVRSFRLARPIVTELRRSGDTGPQRIVQNGVHGSMRRGETAMKKTESQKSRSPSRLIDARIRELGDWRGKMLSRLRILVREADPQVVEEWKWRGVPVWSHDGIVCTGETYKNVVKMTFAKGARLQDRSRLFNSSLEGNTRRAIDFHEGEEIDEEALKTLVRDAVTLNKAGAPG